MGTQFFYTDLSDQPSTPLSATKVRLALLDLLRYASKGGIEENGEAHMQDIALLFDQLINLVAAAETLHQASGAPLDNNRQKGEAHE